MSKKNKKAAKTSAPGQIMVIFGLECSDEAAESIVEKLDEIIDAYDDLDMIFAFESSDDEDEEEEDEEEESEEEEEEDEEESEDEEEEDEEEEDEEEEDEEEEDDEEEDDEEEEEEEEEEDDEEEYTEEELMAMSKADLLAIAKRFGVKVPKALQTGRSKRPIVDLLTAEEEDDE